MQVIDVTAEMKGIKIFPDNVMEEIIQNVRTILTTIVGSVPLDRDFGINMDLLDNPVTVIRPLLVHECKTKIEKYEPRVKFVSMEWQADAMEGIMTPTVKVAIR